MELAGSSFSARRALTLEDTAEAARLESAPLDICSQRYNYITVDINSFPTARARYSVSRRLVSQQRFI